MGKDKIVVVNPATLDRVAEVSVKTPQEVEQMVAMARKAQKEWSNVSIWRRMRALRELQRYIVWHHKEFISVVQLETGKVWPDAMLDPLSAVNEIAAWCSKAFWDNLTHLGTNIWTKNVRPWPHWVIANKKVTIRRRPKPVVGVIAPWNLPLAIPAADVIPALLAGSAVILKPSEFTPLTALELERVMGELGCFPEKILQVAPGYGETGEALTRLADAILFTGSVSTGRKVEVICRERGITYHLEMGGKAPFVVWPPVNLKRAVRAAVWSKFANCGHYCKSPERFYVASSVWPDFVAGVVDLTNKLRPGVDYGPVITDFQLNIIENRIHDAVTKGAKIIAGGKRIDRRGRWFEPTVLLNCDHSMDVMTKETFGPIMPIMRVESAADVLPLINDSHLGLNASIFTDDRELAKKLIDGIEAGNPNVDEAMLNWFAVGAPQCGCKDSVGVMCNLPRHGEHGLDRTCDLQTFVENRFSAPFPNTELWWYPYTELTKLTMRFFIHSFWPFV